MLMWAMSDAAGPRSLRTYEGFGIHTFRLVNGQGRISTFVKSNGGHASARLHLWKRR